MKPHTEGLSPEVRVEVLNHIDLTDINVYIPESLYFLAEACPLPNVSFGEVDSFESRSGKPVLLPEHRELLEPIGVILPYTEDYNHTSGVGLKVLHMRACAGDSLAQQRLWMENYSTFAYLVLKHFPDSSYFDNDLVRESIYLGFSTCLSSSKLEILAGLNNQTIKQLMFKSLNWSMKSACQKKSSRNNVILTPNPNALTPDIIDLMTPELVYLQKISTERFFTVLDELLQKAGTPRVREALRHKLINPKLTFTELANEAGVSATLVQTKFWRLLWNVGYTVRHLEVLDNYSSPNRVK